jgi:hypothetical protein
MANNQSQDLLREMRRSIRECFGISDLRGMCGELGIDDEEFAGDDNKTKVVEE